MIQKRPFNVLLHYPGRVGRLRLKAFLYLSEGTTDLDAPPLVQTVRFHQPNVLCAVVGRDSLRRATARTEFFEPKQQLTVLGVLLAPFYDKTSRDRVVH